VRTVGQAGEGPGVCARRLTFTVLRDGTIVIGGHVGTARISSSGRTALSSDWWRFSGDGSLIRVGDLAADPGVGRLQRRRQHDGLLSRQGSESAPRALPTDRPIERISLAGCHTPKPNSWPAGGSPPRPGGAAPMVRAAGERTSLPPVRGPVAFEPLLLMGPLADGGVAYSDSTAYAVKVVSPRARSRG